MNKPLIHPMINPMINRIRSVAAASALLSVMTAAGAANHTAILTGANEAPPNASPGIGAAIIKFDQSSHVLEINVAFSGLLGETTAAHIHCCTAAPGGGTAGVATQTPTFAGFPLGVTHGAYSSTFDTSLASSWNAAFITANGGTTAGAEAAFTAGLNSGRAYLNLHSELYPAGEIRGFLASAVPEASTIAMFGLGLPLVALAARRRRRPPSAT